MWKKPERIILVMITSFFIAVMFGVFLGRRSSQEEIHLSDIENVDYTHTSTSQTEPTRSGKLNINFATARELAMLPGIGDTNAQHIIDYRNKNGPFLSIDDLLNVKGIGQKRFDSISKYITVGG